MDFIGTTDIIKSIQSLLIAVGLPKLAAAGEMICAFYPEMVLTAR